MPADLPAIDDVQDSIRSLGQGTGAAELHGGLSGWLAGGGANGPGWLAEVLAEPALGAADGTLETLRKATSAQMEDPSFGFQLLLPGQGAPLYERTGALFDWCRGFLGGFGLAAGAEPPLSDEGKEALADIAKLAAANPQEDGDEEDERALAEIQEFVRVAVLLIHGDCALGPRHRQSFN